MTPSVSLPAMYEQKDGLGSLVLFYEMKMLITYCKITLMSKGLLHKPDLREDAKNYRRWKLLEVRHTFWLCSEC